MDGFAIATLRRRHGVLATGLIVGIWWERVAPASARLVDARGPRRGRCGGAASSATAAADMRIIASAVELFPTRVQASGVRPVTRSTFARDDASSVGVVIAV